MNDFAAIGRQHVIDQIEGLEAAHPGWLPMFYATGSFEGDIQAAEALRKKFDMPRPKEVAARISLSKTRHTERMAIAQAESDLHKLRMREDWLYWTKVKLGFVRR